MALLRIHTYPRGKLAFVVVLLSIFILFVLFHGKVDIIVSELEAYNVYSVQSCLKDTASSRLALPSDYSRSPDDLAYCQDRYGSKYLSDLEASADEYCTEKSLSSLYCFHDQTAGQRIDTFCLGRASHYDPIKRRFVLDCDLSPQPKAVPLHQLTGYWYETGPLNIFNNFINITKNSDPSSLSLPKINDFKVLLKREGDGNTWHCLMEILSLSWTLDILQITRDNRTHKPLLTKSDLEKTEIIVLDDHKDGPYWDLWRLFAPQGLVRLAELDPGNIKTQNIIIPLAGGGNPIWQGDWEVKPCDRSELLDVFLSRVLDYYSIQTLPWSTEEILVTFIDRRGTRQLENQDKLLELVGNGIPHVRIQSVDFAAISLSEQIQIVRDTDVLVGVHGAGLTHLMWLRSGAAVVELLPQDMNYKGFKNLAAVLRHGYFSTHANKTKDSHSHKRWLLPKTLESEVGNLVKRDDWHFENVTINQDKWLDLIKAAVVSVHNRGMRNFEVS